MAADPVLLQQLMQTVPNFPQQLEHLTLMYQQAVIQVNLINQACTVSRCTFIQYNYLSQNKDKAMRIVNKTNLPRLKLKAVPLFSTEHSKREILALSQELR